MTWIGFVQLQEGQKVQLKFSGHFTWKQKGQKLQKAAAGCCWSLELEFPEVLRSLTKGWRGSMKRGDNPGARNIPFVSGRVSSRAVCDSWAWFFYLWKAQVSQQLLQQEAFLLWVLLVVNLYATNNPSIRSNISSCLLWCVVVDTENSAALQECNGDSCR